jgi:hypothetical protein
MQTTPRTSNAPKPALSQFRSAGKWRNSLFALVLAAVASVVYAVAPPANTSIGNQASATYTDASNYEKIRAAWSSNTFYLTTQKAGTGTARHAVFGTEETGNFYIRTNAVERWLVNSSGHFLPNANGTYDIGLTGTRVRTGFFQLVDTTGSGVRLNGVGYLQGTASGVFRMVNDASDNFDRLCWGPVTSSFPSLKRSTTKLIVRLADDSADTRLDCSAVGGTGGRRIVTLLVSDPNGDPITPADGKVFFRVPAEFNGMNLVDVAACCDTASSENGLEFQIRRKRSGVDVDMLATALNIDVSTNDSSDSASPAVIDTDLDDVQTADRIYIDCDSAGTGAKGVEVQLSFQLP